MSLGLPSRRSGMVLAWSLVASFRAEACFATRAVVTSPGATQFTRTLFGPSSTASDFVYFSIAAFAAEYIAKRAPASSIQTPIVDTFTIAPPCLLSTGEQAWHMLTAVSKFTANSLRRSSSLANEAELTSTGVIAPPALFIRISMRPKWRSISSTASKAV